MYCLKCRRVTETENITTTTSKNGRLIRQIVIVIVIVIVNYSFVWRHLLPHSPVDARQDIVSW